MLVPAQSTLAWAPLIRDRAMTGERMAIEETAADDDTPETLWNITEVIEQQARRHPAALAMVLADRMISYRELIVAVHVIAHKPLYSGVRAGQTLGVSMAQNPIHLMTLLAIVRIGAISRALYLRVRPKAEIRPTPHLVTLAVLS